jgi:sortase (surface protein transpeptidase)
LFALLLLFLPAPRASAQELVPVPFSGAQPVAISIPSLRVNAEVVPLGLEEDGAMSAPTDPDTVGWFELGAGIGAPGNVLLDGHVDWGGQRRVFGLLHLLEPGDRIHVTEPGGSVLSYSVTWTKFYADAASAPLEEIFGQYEPIEELTLITCGGEFDDSVRMYQGRWVVRAARDEVASAD